ncbi:hypothetical protein PanWU01x14_125030, partial [Parasponia andersonii]
TCKDASKKSSEALVGCRTFSSGFYSSARANVVGICPDEQSRLSAFSSKRTSVESV